MSATKLADLTLAIQKATEGFTEIVDRLTDNDIINIRHLLLPVLMKTKYDKLALAELAASLAVLVDTVARQKQ